MVQHLLLMMAAPPLLWLGAPLFPLLRGLPQPIRTYWVAPLFCVRRLAPALRAADTPRDGAACLRRRHLALAHARRSTSWPCARRAGTTCSTSASSARRCCSGIRSSGPIPSRPRWSPWLLLPYLILADVQNTVLSALLTFSDRVLYPYYAAGPTPRRPVALDDQAAAGVIMWVPGSVAFLLPLFWIGVRLLYGPHESSRRKENGDTAESPHRPADAQRCQSPTGTSTVSTSLPDARPLVRSAALPAAGPLPALAARPARLAAAAGAAGRRASIYDGLRGPQVGADEPGRRAAVDSLARPGDPGAAGGRQRLLHGLSLPAAADAGPALAPARPGLAAPAAKQVAGGAVCWCCFCGPTRPSPSGTAPGGRRGSPSATSWRPSSSTASSAARPSASTSARSASSTSCSRWCRRWRSRSATRRSARRAGPRTASAAGDGIPGCELHLFQPRKVGNMDCTFCLDCVHACPHDNIGMLAGTPGAEICGATPTAPASAASASGRTWRRWSWCWSSARSPTPRAWSGPVVEWQDRLVAAVQPTSPLLLTIGLSMLALDRAPARSSVAATAILSRWWGRLGMRRAAGGHRFSFALVPLGFGMWLAHYSFHFLTSYDTIVPTTQR